MLSVGHLTGKYAGGAYLQGFERTLAGAWLSGRLLFRAYTQDWVLRMKLSGMHLRASQALPDQNGLCEFWNILGLAEQSHHSKKEGWMGDGQRELS